MIALIIAPGINPGLEALNKHYPTPLLPLVDRPFIQHMVEFLIREGVTRFDFVLSHFPEKMEELLGDGSRWGSEFRFHLAQDPLLPYETLKTIEFDADDSILLGWAWIPGKYTRNLPSLLDEKGLETHFLSLAAGKERRLNVEKQLNVQTFESLLTSHRTLLDKGFPGLTLVSRETEPGIWLSRNVSLHPTTRLIPPVYINEDCRIGSGITLGPHATIGSGSVLDSGCFVENAAIFPNTYVGDGLELKDVLVDKNRLMNARHNTAVSISEDFILGGVSASDLGIHFRTVVSQVAAIALLLLLWPLLLTIPLLLKVFRRGPAIFKKQAIRLPTESDDAFWHTFNFLSFVSHETSLVEKSDKSKHGALHHLILQFVPALLSVAGGNLHFVGVKPRSREEIGALDSDWRDLYLKSKAGIVTEAYINYGDHPTEDEIYTSEVFYASTSGLGHDFKLFFTYLRRLFRRERHDN
ncbi:MAG: hypothetical protein B6240_14115 [Desulfobacteraceae bacterium 4572_87]|nr:MAG: hypothetical protein B6240_14115 [Desulfobacteraceae bacterium 4572_87]